MRSMLRFLVRNNFFLLFLILEAIAVVFVVNYNNFQKVKFLNTSNVVSGNILNTYSSVYNYFQLTRINEQLSSDNAMLRKRLQDLLLSEMQSEQKRVSTTGQEFQFTSARVINNSANKQYNYITLNKGSQHGIKPDMGIIGPGGVVGVIRNVSENFSTGPVILNKRWRVSSKVNSYYGSLAWDGINFKQAKLNEIPFHVEIKKGDQVVTSGYSSVFPEGVMLGTIVDFKHESGNNFYDITVELSTDFKKLSYVKIITNSQAEEQQELENRNTND